MKRKSFVALMSGLFSFGAIALSGALILNSKGAFKSFLAKADPDQGSYTITAADFNVNGNGSLIAGGETWNFEGASVSGNTVSISGILYSNSFSGTSVSNNRRGDGYTRIVINGLDQSEAVGLVLYEKAVNQSVKNTITTITSDMDLTVGGTIASADRRGLQFAQGAGGYFSFTSMTFYYACTTVTPEVHIDESALSIGVGETGQLHTSTVDVSEGAGETYSWASDDEDVATVDNNGLVTGVGAGSANITVTMSLNGHDYTDSLEITVTAAAATVVPMDILDTSGIQGAGIFCRFDPSSASVTANQLDTYTASVEVEFADPNVNNAVNHYVLQEKGDSSYTAYVVMDSAVGLNGAFTAQADFRDNANNTIYRAVWHFDNSALDQEIHLSAASFSVNEGDDLQVTATKASWLEGTASFTFESLDTSIFTVTNVDNVVTVHGVAEGSATLRVVMQISGVGAYSLDKTIAVTQSGVQHLITWYTEGEGNQRNHWDGAGVWTWVNYGALGYNDFGSFSAKKSNMTVACDKTGIRIEVISDDIASIKVCRVYLVANAAETTSVITLNIPDVNGVTYTGSITFVSGEATAYNA